MSAVSLTALAEFTVDSSKLTSDYYITSATTYKVAQGVTETHITTNNASGTTQNQGYVLEVDLSDPTVSIISSYKDQDASSWGMQTVRDQAEAAETLLDVNVVAGINGSPYNMTTGMPYGVFVFQGEVYLNEPDERESYESNLPYFAIMNDGTAVIGNCNPDTENMASCVTAKVYTLVEDGKKTAKAKNDNATYEPRIAIGLKEDGTVVIYETDGRQDPYSEGMTINQLADMMIALGCVDAINLDGGGSATLLSEHEGEDGLVLRNSPADGSERIISSALLICSTAESTTSEAQTPETVTSFTDSDGEYTGFAAENGNLTYYIGGNKQTDWTAVGDDVYCFDENGYAVTGTFTEDGHTYTFGDDGKLTKGSLEKQSDGTYCYYIAGEKQRGWHEIDGKLYFFNRSNSMKTCSGETTVNDGTSDEITYTFSSSGYLTDGAWYETEYGVKYYWGLTPVSGFYEIDGDMYYFDPANYDYMVTSSIVIDGVAYTFAPDGKFLYYGEYVSRTVVDSVEKTCTTDGYEAYEDMLADGSVVSYTITYEATGHIDDDGDYACDVCGEKTASSFAIFFYKIADFFRSIINFIVNLFT
ncbi:MAG: phosphodiester glycosidase family protein [Clostridiales bacterium]|nr:phosphodiester glycosidase family protein [Clostridiales bacterium]